MDRLVCLLDFSLSEMEEFFRSLGQPPFRAKQVFQWVYHDLTPDLAEMTTLPKSLRDRLLPSVVVQPLGLVTQTVSEDGLTRKGLFRLLDGSTIESVLMLYPTEEGTRRTVCVSSQVGCAMGCEFCATGKAGFSRNLTSGEILGQVLHFAKVVADKEGPAARITNVVFMGQGEPLANFDAVWKAIETMNSPYGLNVGARHITISTVGLPSRIRQLAERPLQVGLAISLHAPDDTLRARLMPVGQRFPIADVMDACRDYIKQTGRRVTFEYSLLDGVNDSTGHTQQLARLLRGLLCHVNLIPLNYIEGTPFRPSPWERVLAFQRELISLGINTTVRMRRGGEIAAACGQLRGAHEAAGSEGAEKPAAEPPRPRPPARPPAGGRIVPSGPRRGPDTGERDERRRPFGAGRPRADKPPVERARSTREADRGGTSQANRRGRPPGEGQRKRGPRNEGPRRERPQAEGRKPPQSSSRPMPTRRKTK